ncbi:MAG: translocation/assembly module TamB domain-containing protein [Bacteroidota bacterium]
MKPQLYKYLVRPTLGLLGVCLLLLFLLHTSWGLTLVGKTVLRQLDIFPGATLTIDKISGSPFGSLSIESIELTAENDSLLADIEHVDLEYSLRQILRGTYVFEKLAITSPQIRMTQIEDASWDLMNVLPESDTTAATPYVQFDHLSITRGTVAAHTYTAGTDSTYYIRDLKLLLAPLTLDEGLTMSLEHLAGEIWVPDTHEPVDLWLAAQYDGAALALDSLQLSSSRSNVVGEGTLYLTTADSLLYQNTLSLSADPLSFDDIRLFAPSLQPGAEVEMTIAVDGRSVAGAGNQLIADADVSFSDGANIQLAGTWQKQESGIGNIALTSNIRGLNPKILTTNPNLAADLNADLKALLSGETFKTIDGTGNLTLVESTIQTYSLDSTAVNLTFDNGVATLDVVTGLETSSLKIAGTLAPFSTQPAYNLTGDVAQLDLSPFLPEQTMDTNLNGAIKLEGNGFSLADAATSLTLELAPSRINDYQVSNGTLNADLSDQQLTLGLQLYGPASQVSSEGIAQLGSEIEVDTLRLSLDNFDLMAVLGDTTSSAITATAALAGTVAKDGGIDVILRSTFTEIAYNSISVTNTALNATWAKDQISVVGDGNLGPGSFNIAGQVQLGEDNLSYEITEGQFSNLDIGQFAPQSAQTSALNGSFFLVGNGTAPAVRTVSGQVELQASRLNRQEINDASVWIAMHADTLDIDLALNLPEGKSSLGGRISSLQSSPTYQISRGEMQGINVGALAGIDSLSTDLNGALLLSGQGTKLADMTARVDLVLTPSQINNFSFSESRSTLSLFKNEAAVSSSFVFEEGLFDVKGALQQVAEAPAFTFTGKTTAFDLAGLIGADSVASGLNLHMEGSGQFDNADSISVKHLSLNSKITATESHYGEVNIDTLALDLSLDDGRLMVDTLLAVSNVALANGSGPIVLDNNGNLPPDARASAFNMVTTLQDLAPLAPLIGASLISAQEGTLRTRIFGEADNLRMDTRIDGNGFVFNTFHLGELDARVTSEFDAAQSLSYTDVTGQITAVSIPGFVFEEINLEATYDTTAIRFATNGRLDKDRRVEVSGRLMQNKEGQEVQLDLINLNLDEDQWSLNESARITLGPYYAVENFLMQSGDQHIELDGVIDLEGEQDLRLDIKNFGVGTVADLLGFTGLDGPVTSQLDLKGPAAAPILEGTLNMALVAFDQPAGDLSIEVDYDSLQLNLDASLTQTGKQVGSVNGVLPVDLSLTTPEASTTGAGISQNVAMEGGVDFAIAADSMAIDWLLPFIDPTLLNRLEGSLTADIKIEGTAQDPTLEGAGRLVNGKIRSPILGVTYEDFSSDIALNDNIIQLTNASMRSGEGFVSGNGSIELSDLTSAILNIDVTASDFLAIDTREYRATASGAMDLTGTLQAPVLNGDVTVLSADLFLNESTSSELADLNVQLTKEDLLMLERNFGIRASAADTTTFDFLDALEMDVEILFGRDVWIRSNKNPEMNIQFSGELDVSKVPYEEYSAFGNIEIIPDRSYINQFGKRFEITLGNLTFNGPATDPQLDFEARYEVPARRSNENAVTIYLDADGKVEDLNLTLRAEPTMELTDILSYIATGQPASEALQLGGINSQSLASTGAGFALNQGVGLLTGAIESLLQDSGLELDVIQIEPQDNARGATITAGKYVTPRIFTAVSQPIGAADSDGTSTREEGTVITLELELIDSLLLRLLGGESVLQINLLWHHSY